MKRLKTTKTTKTTTIRAVKKINGTRQESPSPVVSAPEDHLSWLNISISRTKQGSQTTLRILAARRALLGVTQPTGARNDRPN